MKIINIKKNIYQVVIVLMLVFVLISGVITFEFQKMENKKFSQAAIVTGSLRFSLIPSSQDLFGCAGRDDCLDDECYTACSDNVDNDGDGLIDLADSDCTDATDNDEGGFSNTCFFSGPQHKYVAQAYDQFGFPLSGVRYQWSKIDADNLVKFRDTDEVYAMPVQIDVLRDSSENTAPGDVNQEIYIEPNAASMNNGKAIVNVLAYIGDPLSGKLSSIDVDLFFCLNAWPNTAVFPFQDKAGTLTLGSYSNFKTFYCKDRGNIVDPNDDYPALKVVERGEVSGTGMVCSGGGGNGVNCASDYFINYDGVDWSKNPLSSWGTSPLTVVLSPDAVAYDGGATTFFKKNMWDSGVANGVLTTGAGGPFTTWPEGLVTGEPLNPTAVGVDGANILLIQDNALRRSCDGGANWEDLVSLANDSDMTDCDQYGPWPTDVQFPTDVAMWTNAGLSLNILVMKDDHYRIYNSANTCMTTHTCIDASSREWGICSQDSDCSWGESYSLYDKRNWPTSIPNWSSNISFPVKTIGLSQGATQEVFATGSCEYSGGTCLLKEFLFISNPACSDSIDNDGDGTCDWNGGSCLNKNGVVASMLADSDCLGSNDNSESGTCDDGLDNDNDGAVDYPDDFSCDSYGDVESDPCLSGADCCDNVDNDIDGFIDQNDLHCDNNLDIKEISDCSDGITNDGDIFIDLDDPGCVDLDDDSELGIVECDDGIDNDGDGNTDLLDLDCGDLRDDNESI